MKVDWTIISHSITQSFSSWMVERICIYYSWLFLLQACKRFAIEESCFFHCDPNLYPWQVPGKDYVAGVPICKSYCDAWFDACKNDSTCAKDWLKDFNETGDMISCKNGNSSCQTYTEVIITNLVVLKCDLVILETFPLDPFQPLNLIMRYIQLL